VTKRHILKELSSIYDPLGMISLWSYPNVNLHHIEFLILHSKRNIESENWKAWSMLHPA
jgi:hypothetical protein